jgi:hypothetical protein
MSKFLYLFWNKPSNWNAQSPAEMERRMKKWMGWMDSLKDAGHFKGAGERLEDTGSLVRGKAKTVTDGPYAEAKDTIGGYIVVEAKDLKEAVELSKGCPVLEGEGLVEVRPIASM